LKADIWSIRLRVPSYSGNWIKPINSIKNSLFRNRYLISFIDLYKKINS
jgi:hypothetical protein